MSHGKRKLLRRAWLEVAEGEGFEPPETCASTVFKTAAFDHSAIPPNRIWIALVERITKIRVFFRQTF